MVLSDDDAVMFGGWSGNSKDQSAAIAFSLQEKTKGDAEPAKEEDQSCDFCMTLRTADMQWVRNKYVGVPASRRYGHTATAIGPHLIIIGGWDGGKPLNDVIVLRDKSVSDKGGDDLFGDGDGVDGYAGDYGGEFDFGPNDEDFAKGDDWTLDAGA